MSGSRKPKAIFTPRCGKCGRGIHDLEVLLALITPTDPDFEVTRDLLLLLNDYAVDYRYPGTVATKEEARAAVKAMRATRAFVRGKLGLP